jgi:hypothetical protein
MLHQGRGGEGVLAEGVFGPLQEELRTVGGEEATLSHVAIGVTQFDGEGVAARRLFREWMIAIGRAKDAVFGQGVGGLPTHRLFLPIGALLVGYRRRIAGRG